MDKDRRFLETVVSSRFRTVTSYRMLEHSYLNDRGFEIEIIVLLKSLSLKLCGGAKRSSSVYFKWCYGSVFATFGSIMMSRFSSSLSTLTCCKFLCWYIQFATTPPREIFSLR